MVISVWDLYFRLHQDWHISRRLWLQISVVNGLLQLAILLQDMRNSLSSKLSAIASLLNRAHLQFNMFTTFSNDA